MPSSTVTQILLFTTGCVLGASTTAVAVFLPRRRSAPPVLPPPATSTSTPAAGSSAVVLLPQQPTADSRALTVLDTGDVLKDGYPGPISDLLRRTAYAAGYDRRLRHPAWTAEHLTLSSLGRLPSPPSSPSPDPKPAPGDRTNSQFAEDPAIPEPYRAKLADYFRSGYDRGHMVPAADAKISQKAMDETFLLSNIAPQVGQGFNRNYWAYVEDWCRRLTGNFADVYVFTVPLYLPSMDPSSGKAMVSYEVIGHPPSVSVPTHFAKVVLASRPSSPSNPTAREVGIGAFVLPNKPIEDETPFESFVVPVDAVERASGLTLFSNATKTSAKPLCSLTKCDVMVRRFEEAQRGSIGGGGRRAIVPPGVGGR